MVNKEYTALLTATIDSAVFNNVENVITDVEIRKEQYEQALNNYLVKSVFTNIVFAENSGYCLDIDEYECLARKHGKNFEYIKCPSYIAETIKYGKGYGEVRLINDALERSSLLEKSDTIYKLTGRIFLENSYNIVKTKREHDNEFLIVDQDDWCYTHIFKFCKKDYSKYLSNAYEYIVHHRLNLEHTFYHILSDYGKYMDVGSFGYWPYFIGISGTNGSSYSSSKKGRLYHTLLCKIGAYNHNSITSGLTRL